MSAPPDRGHAPTDAPPFDAFLSHAGEDRAVASQWRDALMAQGLRPWASFTDIPVGASYPDRIVQAIGQSRVLLLLVSNASLRSPHVQREIAEAASIGKPIMPLYIEPDIVVPDGVRYYLQRLHRLRVKAEDIQKVAPLIAAAIRNEDVWRKSAERASWLSGLAVSPWRMWAGAALVVLAGGLGVWALQGAWQIRQDARRQAELDARPDAIARLVAVGAEQLTHEPGQPWSLDVQLMMAAELVPLDRLHLMVGLPSQDGAGMAFTDITRWMDANRAQHLTARVPRLAQHITLCLIAPHPRTGASWRVTTAFAAQPSEGAGADRPALTFRQVAPAQAQPGDGC